MGVSMSDRFFLDLFFIRVELIYTTESISALQHSDPIIHIYTFFFSYYLPHGLSQETGYS